MTSDSEIRKLCEEVELGESWLRAEADKRWQSAKGRRSSANTMRNATEDELKSAKRMAESVAGRKLDLVSTSVAKAKAGADIDDRIADKYESEAELLIRIAGYLSLLRARMEEDRFDFRAHLQRQREFSEKTFGPGTRTQGVIDHIRKELREIEADPTDISEWIDVTILALDGAWRVGFSPDQIIAALVAKQDKNEKRDWPDWRTADPNKAIEHVRPLPSAPEVKA